MGRNHSLPYKINSHSPLSGPFADSLPVRTAASLFGAAVAIRNAAYDRASNLSRTALRPVISIGGISAGGTGKTPVALLVGKYLLSKGRGVAFLSRGYRRKDRRPRIVAPDETVGWEQIGDEPWLLHHRLPQSWLGIDASRVNAAAALAHLVSDRCVFVLDDGFQHRALRCDLDIVCLRHDTLRDRMIPAGFLREPVTSLSRASMGLLIGSTDQRPSLYKAREDLTALFPKLPLSILFQEKGPWVNAGTGEEALSPPLDHPLLVCGIARPERFIAMARSSGITPSAELIFPDHHHFITNDFIKTRKLYSSGIITTEKDAIRLRRSGIVPDEKLWYLSLRLGFESDTGEKQLHQLIDKHILYSLSRRK